MLQLIADSKGIRIRNGRELASHAESPYYAKVLVAETVAAGGRVELEASGAARADHVDQLVAAGAQLVAGFDDTGTGSGGSADGGGANVLWLAVAIIAGLHVFRR